MLVFISVIVMSLSRCDAVALGRCKSDPDAPPPDGFNFNKMSKDGGGIWQFWRVPDVKRYENVTWMFEASSPMPQADTYRVTTYCQRKGEPEPTVLSDQVRRQLADGRVIITTPTPAFVVPGSGEEKTNVKIIFLAYEPGRFVYFYLCSDEGVDDETDHRFVLIHDYLKTKDQLLMWKIDLEYGFKGELKRIAF